MPLHTHKISMSGFFRLSQAPSSYFILSSGLLVLVSSTEMSESEIRAVLNTNNAWLTSAVNVQGAEFAQVLCLTCHTTQFIHAHKCVPTQATHIVTVHSVTVTEAQNTGAHNTIPHNCTYTGAELTSTFARTLLEICQQGTNKGESPPYESEGLCRQTNLLCYSFDNNHRGCLPL